MSVAKLESNDISLLSIINKLLKIMEPATNDVMALIEEIDLFQYEKIRADINNVFLIGEVANFKGFVEEETEFGDITGFIQDILQERYPIEKVKGKVDSVMLTVKDRTEWRDQLIHELDKMVEQ